MKWYLTMAAWGVTTTVGMLALALYSGTAGSDVPSSLQWPAESPLPFSIDKPNLLVFFHPRCPCSRATATELNRVVAGHPEVSIVPVMFCPEPRADEWANTTLVRNMTEIAGAGPFEDVGGLEATRFGATTSGHVMLYSPDGRLLFSGGVTSSRGHEGENTASDSLKRVLRGESPQLMSFPVYGCPIATRGRDGQEKN